MTQPTQAEMLQNMLQTLAQGQLDMQRVITTQAETQQRLDANLQTALSQLGEAKDVILQQQTELQALKVAAGTAVPGSSPEDGPAPVPLYHRALCQRHVHPAVVRQHADREGHRFQGDEELVRLLGRNIP